MTRKTLRERLVLAVIEALQDGDPTLIVGIGDQELKIGWSEPTK